MGESYGNMPLLRLKDCERSETTAGGISAAGPKKAVLIQPPPPCDVDERNYQGDWGDTVREKDENLLSLWRF